MKKTKIIALITFSAVVAILSLCLLYVIMFK